MADWARVDASVAELLVTAQPLGNVQAQTAELLWGTPGTVPTQESATYVSGAELLLSPGPRGIVAAQTAEVLWTDLTFELQVEAQTAELLWGTPGTARTQDAAAYLNVAEFLLEPATSGDVQAQIAALLVEFAPAVAIVDDIGGRILVPALFDGTTSTGLIFAYRWSWQSVPGGSAIGNSAQPFPDLGGTTPIDMTSNTVLYHAEETVGVTGTDTSGSGNDATLTAITVGAAGQVGLRSWEYTGSTSKAQPAVPVSLPGSGWTIAFWFYNLAPTTAWRTGARGQVADHQIIVENGGDRVGVYMSGAFRPTDTEYTLTVGGGAGWHHIAAVGTLAGNTRIYVDGLFRGSVVGFRSTDAVASLGNYQGNGQRFADRLDEIAIWGRALSDKEILDLYYLQEGSYTGVESTHTFTPDVLGLYDIELTTVDGVTLALSTDTAQARIGKGGRFHLQGDKIRYREHLQGAWHINPRGGNKT